MKIWATSFLLLYGVIQFSNGQNDFNFEESFSESHFPDLFEVSESSYFAEDDGNNQRSYKLYDAKPRVPRSSLYKLFGVRDKRETTSDDDYDYAKTYRDFVRENFGFDDVKSDSEDDDDGDSDYKRVKELSDRETEKSKKHSDYCKIVYRGDKECTVCKNPKTNAHSETCSYSSKPKPKKYAYKRERNYNSKNNEDDDNNDNDDDDGDINYEYDEEATQKQEQKIPKHKQKKSRIQSKKPTRYENDDFHPIQVKSSKRNKSKKHTPKQADSYFIDQTFKPSEPYETTAVDKKVDEVLERFKKSDWSKCKRKIKSGLTCYYCKDAKGVSNEECMYISDENHEVEPYLKDVDTSDKQLSKEIKKIATRKPQQITRASTVTQKSHKPTRTPKSYDIDRSPSETNSMKRVVSVKIDQNGDSNPAANKKVFYKKIVQVDRK